jgi:hypothetical protein
VWVGVFVWPKVARGTEPQSNVKEIAPSQPSQRAQAMTHPQGDRFCSPFTLSAC